MIILNNNLNRAPAFEQLNLPRDDLLSLEDRCADAVLKTIFPFPDAGPVSVQETSFLLPDVTISTIISRLPSFACEELIDTDFYTAQLLGGRDPLPERFRLRNAIDRFDELASIEIFNKYLRNAGNAVKIFVEALEKTLGFKIPLLNQYNSITAVSCSAVPIDYTAPFRRDGWDSFLLPYPTYENARHWLSNMRVIRSREVYLDCAQTWTAFRDLPLYPNRVYALPGYGVKWESWDRFLLPKGGEPVYN